VPSRNRTGAAVSGDEVLDLGSLNEVLRNSSAARNLASWDSNLVGASDMGAAQNLLRSAGPISDAYMLGTDDVALLNGPGGSGKTIASAKKALISAQRICLIGTGAHIGAFVQHYEPWLTLFGLRIIFERNR